MEETSAPQNSQSTSERFTRAWPLTGSERRGTVLLVHGLGEHSGRYEAVARALNSWGSAVHGYDHYGHGRSAGKRGTLRAQGQLLQDLASMVDMVRGDMQAGEPLVLLGHSMGGLVAASFVARRVRPVDALVLSAPALAIFTTALQRMLIRLLPRCLPNLCLNNGLDAQDLSHDAAVVAAYEADPLCHDGISTRLAAFIATEGDEVLARAGGWSVPTLLMWGSDDRMMNPDGCRRLAATAPARVMTAHEFPGLYHEILNETDKDLVFTVLRDWLQTTVAAAAS